MVKNTKGGNKAKKMGRKFLEEEIVTNVRYKTDEEEIYCVVTKILGGENCEVLCEDAKIRLCVIRGKFRGKKKRNNLIKPGGLILAGKREWEVTNANKRDKCDLLYIYSDGEKNKIIKSIENDSIRKVLLSEEDNTDNFEFTNQDNDNNDNNNNNDNFEFTNKDKDNKDNNLEFDFDSI